MQLFKLEFGAYKCCLSDAKKELLTVQPATKRCKERDAFHQIQMSGSVTEQWIGISWDFLVLARCLAQGSAIEPSALKLQLLKKVQGSERGLLSNWWCHVRQLKQVHHWNPGERHLRH